MTGPAPGSGDDRELLERTAAAFPAQGLPMLADLPGQPHRSWLRRPATVVTVVGWAFQHTFSRLGDVFRLATRALPLLLLFITFLFINTEVWQVAGSLSAWLLWTTIGFFIALGVGFLLARLPEELERVDASVSVDDCVAGCVGTPLEERVRTLDGLVPAEPLSRRERSNLVLVMLFAQMVQVSLLALSVWLFFVLFGSVAIGTDVQESWLGHEPHLLVGIGEGHGVTAELLRVSTFLGGFAGLYFTVYAVTDSAYRNQFFSEITGRLTQGLALRSAYRALARTVAEEGAASAGREPPEPDPLG